MKFYKITTSLLSSHILLKIKNFGANNILIWLFGPLGVLKINLRILIGINYHTLMVLFFNSYFIDLVKRKVSYLTSVGDLLRSGIINLSKGYMCYVRVKGVGYKIEQLKSSELSIILGYSHKVIIKVPFFLKVHVLKKRTLVWSYSLAKLQHFCKMLKFLKKKDPYNGKGIIQPHLQRKLKIGKISRV